MKIILVFLFLFLKAKKVCRSLDLLQSIKEDVIQFSSSIRCQDHCRLWDEIKEIAFCKIKLISEYIEQPYNIFYTRTDYKTEGKNEIARFTFIAIKETTEVAQNSQESQVQKVKGGSFFLKVCVPVNSGQNSWIDDKCPFDDCKKCKLEQLKVDKYTICSVNLDQEIHETIEDDIITQIPQKNQINVQNLVKK